MKWLIFGGKGWIGSQICQLLKIQEETIIHANCRADDEQEVKNELMKVYPDRVISLIGRTTGPGFSTIDYLEQKDKLVENIRDNLYAPLVLAMICTNMGLHLTYLGTGCIFDGYEGDSGSGYSEKSKPDFFGSSYSTVKGFTDRLMHMFENNVLNLRIRMPITNKKEQKNFITKIMTYQKICSIPNSMSVLPELLPIAIDMAKNKVTGTINLTNPGLITHNEILEIVKEIIDPNFKWQNFTIEEQDKILLAHRSNNLLNTDKLKLMYPQIAPIKDAIRKIIMEIKLDMMQQ